MDMEKGLKSWFLIAKIAKYFNKLHYTLVISIKIKNLRKNTLGLNIFFRI